MELLIMLKNKDDAVLLCEMILKHKNVITEVFKRADGLFGLRIFKPCTFSVMVSVSDFIHGWLVAKELLD